MKITQKSIIYMPQKSTKVKTVFCWPNWSKQWNFPEWSRPSLWLVARIDSSVWGPSRCPNQVQDSSLEGLWLYFPTPLEFLNLELIWPLKSHFSQGSFLQLKKGAESQNLHVFWAFGSPNLHKIWNPSIGKCIFAWKFQKCRVFPVLSCPHDWSRAGWDHSNGQNL